MFKDNANKMKWNLLAALAYSESTFNPQAKSKARALGLMQFMPKTWIEWAPDGADLFDPEVSIRVADEYLFWLYNHLDQNIYHALIAYMWGIGNVFKSGWQNAPEIVKDRADHIVRWSELLLEWERLNA